MPRSRPKFDQKCASEAPLGGAFGPTVVHGRATSDLRLSALEEMVCKFLCLSISYKGLRFYPLKVHVVSSVKKPGGWCKSDTASRLLEIRSYQITLPHKIIQNYDFLPFSIFI